MSSLKSSPSLNVFTGDTALLDYLDPGKQPPTPLVELPRNLNELRDDNVRIFAKAAFLNPLLTMKLNASRAILNAALAKGSLAGVNTLVENSSGGKGLADVILAPHFGIPNVVMTVPFDIPEAKKFIIELLGGTTEKTQGGIEKSREMGKRPGWLNPAQYHNPANAVGSEQWVGSQVWEQTDRLLSLLSAPIGTGGLLTGVSKYLREHSPNVTIIGVTPNPDQVPGVRSLERLKEVGHDWRGALDHHLEVSVKESYRLSLKLCWEGILGGPSSGLALAGLKEFLKGARDSGQLEQLRNEEGEVVAVFICPDTLFPYLDKYTTHLDPADLIRPT